MGALLGEPGRRAPLLGNRKDMYSKALEKGTSFHGGPLGEPGSGLIYQGLRLDDGSGDGYFSP